MTRYRAETSYIKFNDGRDVSRGLLFNVLGTMRDVGRIRPVEGRDHECTFECDQPEIVEALRTVFQSVEFTEVGP